MNRGTGCNVAAGEGDTSGFRFRNMRKGPALCFASNNDNLALAGLVLAAAQVFTVFAAIAGLHIAAKISAIDLYITAQSTLGASQRYGFAHLVAENGKRSCRKRQGRGSFEALKCLSRRL